MAKTNTDIVLRHHHELWSGGNIDSIGDYYAPDFVGHHPGAPDWVGPDHVREVMQRTRQAFPDFREVVEDVIAERDMVVTRFIASGTHRGSLQDFAPTGRAMTMAEISIFRLSGGRIVEKWGLLDRLGMHQQLGTNPLQPRSELLYEITMPLEPAQDVGVTPGGHRRILIVQGGEFNGPRLRGRVLPGGGDWTLTHEDGSSRLDVRITLEPHDGALIYAQYHGILHAEPEVLRRSRAGETVDPTAHCFRVVPFFETAVKSYDWLNCVVAVGVGERMPIGVSYKVYSLI